MGREQTEPPCQPATLTPEDCCQRSARLGKLQVQPARLLSDGRQRTGIFVYDLLELGALLPALVLFLRQSAPRGCNFVLERGYTTAQLSAFASEFRTEGADTMALFRDVDLEGRKSVRQETDFSTSRLCPATN